MLLPTGRKEDWRGNRKMYAVDGENQVENQISRGSTTNQNGLKREPGRANVSPIEWGKRGARDSGQACEMYCERVV